VIEGTISTEYVEPEAPFGELTGYMGERVMFPNFEVKCITHRKDPIYQSFISQFPPSESSKIRKLSREGSYFKLLKYDCNIPGILDVVFHEGSGSTTIVIIQMKKTNNAQPWQALNSAIGFDPRFGKIIIAVDDDINPHNIDAVMWALAYRFQPHLDLRITQCRYSALDPSSAPMDSPLEERLFPSPRGNSALLIDATRKWPYPPTSLPGREFMERAKKIWEEEGLPELIPQDPWYGVSLGYWTKENEEEAVLAVEGEYYRTAEKLAKQKIKV
jgi:4-hydroxy-3-polyprenylbenzoate decarboxylase